MMSFLQQSEIAGKMGNRNEELFLDLSQDALLRTLQIDSKETHFYNHNLSNKICFELEDQKRANKIWGEQNIFIHFLF